MKRLFIIHGWDGSPDEPMIKWLGQKGSELGFDVNVVAMPNPSIPTINAWVKQLDDTVMYVDEDTFFVGHSMGCQAILRYLQTQKGSKIGGAVFIAPWLTLTNIAAGEDSDIARPWVEQAIDFATIKGMSSKFTLIFSDNDPFVALQENMDALQKSLQAEAVIIEKGKGHFSEKDGVTELQSAAPALAKLAQ